MIRLFITFVFLLSCQHSNSHEGRPVYIELVELKTHYSLSWKIPPIVSASEVPSIHLVGKGCKEFNSVIGGGLAGRKQIKCSANEQSETELSIKIHYPEGNPALSSLLHYAALDGAQHNIFSDPDTSIIPLPEASTYTGTIIQYIIAGIEHIAIGFDHLLFVLCLLVIASGWGNLIKTISGFTIGHSITLVLASLNILSVSIELIESLIALSIVFLTVEIVKTYTKKNRNTLTWQHPIIVATLCGLLHGFGFASVLSEFGLPQNMKLTALIFFNVGVEVGQILFVSLVILAMQGFKQISIKQPIEIKSAALTKTLTLSQQKKISIVFYPLGILSTYWFIERSILLF